MWTSIVTFVFFMLYEWIKGDRREHGDTGQSRSSEMKRLCVIMKDKCKPAQTSLNLLLFAEEFTHPIGLIITP